MMIPSDKVSFVIGTKGAVIHDIQRNSGAIVQVERGDSKDPNSLLRGVNISGSAEQIEAAKAEINRVIGTTAGVHEFRDDESRRSHRTRTCRVREEWVPCSTQRWTWNQCKSTWRCR